MLFNSVIFLWFFLIVYGLYIALDHKWQNRMLLVASLIFYGTWDYRFLTLLLASILLDFRCGILIHESATQARRRFWLIVSMTGNLVMLGFFKYFNFFADSLMDLLTFFGLSVNPWTLRILLPVGISFYTFQTMSYTIDIYRRQMKPTYDALNFSLFVSFFPQLVAGPIERARNLLPQVERPRTLNLEQIRDGLFLIAWGIFQKVIIADRVASIVIQTYDNCATATGIETFLAMYAFFIQIYCDFSGYSDVARGLAKMMGFELMLNFRVPFCSVRPADFWSRWHISLTTWIRDYLFVSIGGNKHGTLRTNINLIFVMTIIGLWHGASWTFVLWGLYFGLLQAGHNLIHPFLNRTIRPKREIFKQAVTLASMALNTLAIVLSAVLFRAKDLSQTAELLKGLTRSYEITPAVLQSILTILFLALPLVIMNTIQYRTNNMLAFARANSFYRFAGYLLAVLMVFYIYLFTSTLKGGEEFIYFQF